jgi:MerR family transcriptional regulator, light-induced transcriptional regulator
MSAHSGRLSTPRGTRLAIHRVSETPLKPSDPFPPPTEPSLPIASVGRETGLSKETLRVWERRYGFPQPQRDATGERAYSALEVDKLRMIKRLIDAGHRPGTLVSLETDALAALCGELSPPPAARPEVERCLDLLKAHRLPALRECLSHCLAQEGVTRFVIEIVAPLTGRVGDAWMRGELQIFAEHAYADLVQALLRNVLATLPRGAGRSPRVLLSTFPGEPHGLGLLMAETLLAVDGADCVSLGVQTPVWDLACAASAYECDIVAVSFSGSMNPNQAVAGLGELRAKLLPTIALWAGGSAPVLRRRRIEGVTPVAALAEIGAALRDWRAGFTSSRAPQAGV